MENPALCVLMLSLLPGVGPSRYWSYVERFGSATAVLKRTPDELPALPSAAVTILREFQQREHASKLARRSQQILEVIEQQSACLISHMDSEYPSLLHQIHQPPPLLFTKGNTALLSLPQIAIVGTRHPTQAGIENTKAFAHYLAKSGFTITSGLAIGIDGFAHEASLAAKGGTIAVMATGIDQIYPHHHRQLADAILANQGLLITEFVPGVEPRATNFPRRNRIISGLSLAVLVMEAALRSGSLITARFALEQNREVFALPSSIHNPQAKGCHTLIKQGAHLVESAQDIIENLGGMLSHFADQPATVKQQITTTTATESSQAIPEFCADLDENEQKIMDSIGYDIVSIEQIIERTGLSSSKIAAMFLNLEIKGIVKHSDWGYEVVRKTIQ